MKALGGARSREAVLEDIERESDPEVRNGRFNASIMTALGNELVNAPKDEGRPDKFTNDEPIKGVCDGPKGTAAAGEGSKASARDIRSGKIDLRTFKVEGQEAAVAKLEEIIAGLPPSVATQIRSLKLLALFGPIGGAYFAAAVQGLAENITTLKERFEKPSTLFFGTPTAPDLQHLTQKELTPKTLADRVQQAKRDAKRLHGERPQINIAPEVWAAANTKNLDRDRFFFELDQQLGTAIADGKAKTIDIGLDRQDGVAFITVNAKC